MFTSRAEFRLTLRPDNADQRLTAKGYQVGCVSTVRYNKMMAIQEKIKEGVELLKSVTKTTHHWRRFLKIAPSRNLMQKT